MAVKKNAVNHAVEFRVAKAEEQSFYANDGLTGAESSEQTIVLQISTCIQSSWFITLQVEFQYPIVLPHSASITRR